MRFGISNLIFPSLSDAAKAALLPVVEICDFAPTAYYGSWDKVPAILPAHPYGEAGPAIGALQSLFFGMANQSLVKDDVAFDRLTQHFEYLVSLAADSHIPMLIFGSPGTRAGRDVQCTDQLLAERVGLLADVAAAKSVKLCFEVNSPKFGCEYLIKNAELQALIKQLGHPGLGLHLDVGQMLEEGLDVINYLATEASELVHLHLSAADFTCRMELLPLYCEVVRRLRLNASSADIVLEIQKLGEASESDLVTMCEAIAAEMAR